MNKKSSNAIVIAVSVIAVAFVAVAALLVINFSNSRLEVQGEIPANDASNAATSLFEEVVGTTAEAFSDLTGIDVSYPEATLPTQQESTLPTQLTSTQPAEQTTAAATEAEPTTQAEEPTVPPTETGKTDVNDVLNSTPTSNDALPKDMSFTNLWYQGFDVIGKKRYIFNDDKDPNCMQANFGYNWMYDVGANLIDFHIETCKLPFTYNGKQYRIQLWKGQYISGEIGTVGGEIGLYTREKGKVYTPDHYDCAPKNEWIYMEMTCYWDELGDGNYKPQFTRKYDLFWWATGFVDGQLANLKDTSSLRILGRLTFKDVAQATAFADALASKGFSSVATFRPDVPDTFKRYGKDVIFLWQDVR